MVVALIILGLAVAGVVLLALGLCRAAATGDRLLAVRPELGNAHLDTADLAEALTAMREEDEDDD